MNASLELIRLRLEAGKPKVAEEEVEEEDTPKVCCYILRAVLIDAMIRYTTLRAPIRSYASLRLSYLRLLSPMQRSQTLARVVALEHVWSLWEGVNSCVSMTRCVLRLNST